MDLTHADPIRHRTEVSLARMLLRLEAQFSHVESAQWTAFEARLKANFPNLFELLLHLYGGHYDFYYHLEAILATAARMWLARPPELKALDLEREANPRWF